jgi:hypothetical protein
VHFRFGTGIPDLVGCVRGNLYTLVLPDDERVGSDLDRHLAFEHEKEVVVREREQGGTVGATRGTREDDVAVVRTIGWSSKNLT